MNAPIEAELDKRKIVLRALLYVTGALVAIAMVTSALFVVITVDRVSEVQDQQRDLALGNRQILGRLTDCTTPGGECYDQSMKNQAQAVGSINSVVIYAAACAKQVGVMTVQQIEQCVRTELGRQTAAK